MDHNSKDIDDKSLEIKELNSLDGLNQYLKTQAGRREGRAIPPLENWHPQDIGEMDMVIKANGEWWHEGSKVTRESLVSLFATVLWAEKDETGATQYYLKTPVQKLKITVEDAPLYINDVGIVTIDGKTWLEFTTNTGDVVRLDDEHPIELRHYNACDATETTSSPSTTNDRLYDDSQIRPYMLVRNGLDALIGRNVFYHLIELGELAEQQGNTVLTLQSGGKSYPLTMPETAT